MALYRSELAAKPERKVTAKPEDVLGLPPIGHRQLVVDGIARDAIGGLAAGDRDDYAAIATPVISAHAEKAWLRAEWNLAAVSW
jgi:hypothetical protein